MTINPNSLPCDHVPNQSANPSPTRLPAHDALRGFDMFWLIGGELLPAALLTLTGWPLLRSVTNQFQHAAWHGFTFYDLIFPLFIFIAGVAVGLQGRSLTALPLRGRAAHYQKALRRLLLLILLGVVYNHGWGSGMPADPSAIRYASVLGRIGIAWFVTAMLVWHFSANTVSGISLVLLTGYSLLQVQWPLTAAGSLNSLLDQALLPGISYRHAPFDPEGMYSQLGAIATCLFGALVGRYWRYESSPQRRLWRLAACGMGLVLLGYLLHPFYPLNKSLWTGSFVLLTGGISVLLLLGFHLLLGERKPRLSAPLHWLGNNAILAYLGTK